MKLLNNSFTYDYPFPTVTLAYFLRYPNPYSHHVLSTDVIERHFDAATGRLFTTRLHLKRSKIPAAVFRLLPKSLVGSDSNGQSYILETSVVDIKQGWMDTESRNLEWTGILSVVERQFFHRIMPREFAASFMKKDGFFRKHKAVADTDNSTTAATVDDGPETTGVTTTVTFHSHLGHARRVRHDRKVAGTVSNAADKDEVHTASNAKKTSFFTAWSTSSIQKSIEIIGLRRTREGLSKSKEGMNIVLERLRKGGLVGVFEGMRKDGETAFGGGHAAAPFKMTLGHGPGTGTGTENRVPRHVEHDLFKDIDGFE